MAAVFVVLLSVGIVFGILYILFGQIQKIEGPVVRADYSFVIGDKLPTVIDDLELLTLVGQLVMESDAQFYRTERAQSLAAARLLVNVGAVLVGLTLVVIGGALILARIRGFSRFQVQSNNADKGTFDFMSELPGVLLCLLGALVVFVTLHYSVQDNALTKTRDAPLFFPSSRMEILERIGSLSEVSKAPISQELQQKIDEGCVKNLGKEACR